MSGRTRPAACARVGARSGPGQVDEWQIALFGGQNPPDKHDLVEGKLVQLGMRAAELGTNVVFDFGFWGKDGAAPDASRGDGRLADVLLATPNPRWGGKPVAMLSGLP